MPKRKQLTVAVAISSGSDLVLIAVGVIGVSASLETFPSIQLLLQGSGVALLAGHAVHAARDASRRSAIDPAPAARDAGGSWVGRLLMMSLGNPASWLDTVVVLGSVGATLPTSATVTFPSAPCVRPWCGLQPGFRWPGALAAVSVRQGAGGS